MSHLLTSIKLAAAAGVGALTVAAGHRTVCADELKAPTLKKLSIYHPPEPEILLIPIESELVDTIGRTRRILLRAGEESRGGVQGVIGRWIQVERRVESRIKSLISPEEPITPGILYVGVAALSGSVFARSRSLPTRLVVPPTLFIGALNYFLPKTTHNVNSYITSLERTYFPALADQHQAAGNALRDAAQSVRTGYSSLRGGVSDLIQGSVDGLESTTGLKLREATLGSSAPAQDKSGSIAQSVHERAAEFNKRAAGVVNGVQARFGPQAKEPAGVKEKVEDAVRDVRVEAAAALDAVKEKVDPKNEEPKRLV